MMYELKTINNVKVYFNGPEAMKAWGSAMVCDNGVVCSRALAELQGEELLEYWEVTDKLTEAQK